MNKIILGGGLSGLVCGVLDPSALIITNSVGGVARTENIAPFMIHFSLKAMQFLSAIGCPYNLSTCRVGYYYGNEVHDELPALLAKMYYIKSRGREPEPVDYEAVKKLGGDFLYLAASLEGFIKSMMKIIGERRIRIHNIEEVDLEAREIKVEKKGYRFYGELTSTLPACVFFPLINRRDIDFAVKGKRFELEDEPKYDIKGYDYVYFPEVESPDMLLRITKRADGKYTHEYPYSHMVDYKKEAGVAPYAYILEPKEIPKVKGVKFVGRYAQWKDSILIHNVIEELLK